MCISIVAGREPDEPFGPKYDYVVHAELNAILNAEGKSLRGAKLYTTLFPCNECAKAIIQSGIKTLFYLSSPETKSYLKFKQSEQMFKASEVKLNEFTLSNSSLKDPLILQLMESSLIK